MAVYGRIKEVGKSRENGVELLRLTLGVPLARGERSGFRLVSLK